jgi:hypothetical protein
VEKYVRGMAYLDCHAGRDALRLFKAAAEEGFQPPGVHLHQMLAVVSHRSPTELGLDDLRALDSCHRAAGGAPEARATGVVLDLVRGALNAGQRKAGQHEEETGHDAVARRGLAELETLPVETRDKVRDHLVRFLADPGRSKTDRALRTRLEEARTAGRRQERVPLFFLPDPIRPLHRPPTARRTSPGLRFGLATAWAGLAAGVVLALRVLFSAGPGASVGVPLLWATGGYTLARTLPGVWWRRAQVRDPVSHDAGADGSAGSWFREDISESLTALVRGLAPASPPGAGKRLMRDTLPLRTVLARELTAGCPPGTRNIAGLSWLLYAHARDLVEKWSAGTLLAPRAGLRVRPREWLLCLAAAGALGIGSVWTLTIMAEGAAVTSPGIWLLLIPASWGTVTLGLRLDGARRDQTEREQVFQDRVSFEQRALTAYEEVLRGRPSDAEMATWLDGDLQRLRYAALDEYGLREEDVQDSIFLLDGAEGSPAARVHGCPTRCRHYVVRLFVVTGRGVRQCSWPLDFATGLSGVEEHRAFPHNAITSTQTTELWSPGSGKQPARVHGLEFDLRLGADSGERIVIDFRDLLDHLSDGDLADWRDRELHCSGVAKALRVLEGVAAEGEAWFARRRTHLAGELERLRSQDGEHGAAA